MREADVPPLAAETVAAFMYHAVDHHPAADSGSKDHPEDHPMSGGGAVGRLGKGETVGVVGGPNRETNVAVES